MQTSGDPHVAVRLLALSARARSTSASRSSAIRTTRPSRCSAPSRRRCARISGFDARELGQPVQQSDVIAVAQGVPGVVAVDLDLLYGGTQPVSQTLPSRQTRLLASRDAVAGGELVRRRAADPRSRGRSIVSRRCHDARRRHLVIGCCRGLSPARRGGRASHCARWWRLIARELGALEENLEQLYDDQFIETCADWVAPYIGDLIGYRPLHGVAPRVASPRAEVANTIAYRRRKGTALMLEQLAHDVTDWPARAVEFFEQLATTQYMNHLRPQALGHRRGAVAARVAGDRRPLQQRRAHRRDAPSGIGRRPLQHSQRRHLPVAPAAVPAHARCRWCRIPGDASGRRFRSIRSARTCGCSAARGPSRISIISPRRSTCRHRSRCASSRCRCAPRPPRTTPSRRATTTARPSVVHLARRRRTAAAPAGAAPPGDPDAKQSCASPICAMSSMAAERSSAGPTRTTSADQQIALDPERGRVLLGADRVADTPACLLRDLPLRLLARHRRRRVRANPASETASRRSSPPRRRSRCSRTSTQLAPTGGRLLIDDSLTYAQTPDLQGRRRIGRAERPAWWSARSNGARPLIAAAGTMHCRHRRARHAGARRPRHLRRRAAAAAGGGQRAARRSCCATARWCPASRSTPTATPATPGAAQPRRRASVHEAARSSAASSARCTSWRNPTSPWS